MCMSISRGLVVLFIVLGLNVGNGFAGVNIKVRKALFKSPFVSDAGAQVYRSEGKIDEQGNYKVKTTTAPMTEYKICLFDIANTTYFLQNASSDEDGELKVIGSLLGVLGAGEVDLQAVSIMILSGGTSNTCNGLKVQESGFTVDIPDL